MADKVQWHSRRVAACVLVLLYVNPQRRNRKRWNIIKVWRKPYISRNLTRVAYNTLVQELLLLVFCVVIPCRRNVPQIWTILNFVDELKSCTFVLTSVRHFVECHANHLNRARVLIGWQPLTHVCKPFTNHTRVYQNEKVGEKVGENKDKSYLSPTVCQRICRLFLRRSHTPTWVCQHEFANFSLPCEGRLSLKEQYLTGSGPGCSKAG